jgi:DNA-binding transcriptional ArsR family regulator
MDPTSVCREISQLHTTFGAVLANPQQIQVLDALAKQRRTYAELAADLNLSQTTLASQLQVLEACGLVMAVRQPTGVRYALAERCTVETLGLLHACCRETCSRHN